MTTVQITGGAVEFTRPSNYSTDKSGAKVTLTFMCAEGTGHEEAVDMLDRVIALSVGRAMTMVGDKPAAAVAVSGPNDPVSVIGLTSASPQPWPGPSVGEKIADPAAAPTSGAADIMGMGNGVAENPTALGNVSPTTAEDTPAGAATASPSEPVITDAQMVEAISSKNAHMLNAAADDLARQAVPVALHKLVANYVPPPAKVQAIPAAKRAAFLAQLAAL